MNLGHQIILICIPAPLCFIFIRAIFSGIKDYQLNKSALKKRKKGETFIQWLVYSKFKEEIPFGWRLFYYIVCILPLCGIASCLVLRLIDLELSFTVGRKIAVGIAYFDATWVTILGWMFHNRNPKKNGYDAPFARWFRKKRGMTRKRKK